MFRKNFTLIIIITVVLLICSNFVNATDLNEKKNEIQNQIDETNNSIEIIGLKITQNLEQLSNLDDKINGYENEIYQANLDLEKLVSEIEIVSEKLSYIEEDYDAQRKILEQRIVALYEAGETNYLDVLLKSNSLSDFISNYYLISELVSYDTEIIDNIDRERRTIATMKQTLDDKKNVLKTAKTNQEKTVIALENTRIVRNDYVSRLTEEEKIAQEKIEIFKNELNTIDRELVLLATSNLGEGYVGGVFSWPTPGYTIITSRFGMRVHPIFKVSRLHSGTDIGAPMGANIIAANDGVVVKSEYTVGYGNMIMIDHGGGISTVYGHGSERISQVGDQVKRGDVVMKVGSTGWSTGPHLHFEVRINGVCVDSLPYITSE